MKLWAIAVLHLSYGSNKPMDVFGARWAQHDRRLKEAWLAAVAPEDVVLLPGDISWAIDLQEVTPDLAFLNALPGKKILSRGNHDYWWTSLRKMRSLCEAHGFSSVEFMRNEAFRFGPPGAGIVVAGTRGWLVPGDVAWKESQDRKIYLREEIRLQLSLQQAAQLRQAGDLLLVSFHYPPFDALYVDAMKASETDLCIYGHVHGEAGDRMPEGLIDGIRYINVAGDHLNFAPILLWEEGSSGRDTPFGFGN